MPRRYQAPRIAGEAAGLFHALRAEAEGDGAPLLAWMRTGFPALRESLRLSVGGARAVRALLARVPGQSKPMGSGLESVGITKEALEIPVRDQEGDSEPPAGERGRRTRGVPMRLPGLFVAMVMSLGALSACAAGPEGSLETDNGKPWDSYPAVALELNEAAFRPYSLLDERPATYEEAFRSAEHLRGFKNLTGVIQGTCVIACGTKDERRILVRPFTVEELDRLKVDLSLVQWVIVTGE